MKVVESGVGASRAAELKAVIEAQSAGCPLLVARDREHGQRVFVLEPHDERLWVGRGAACDVRMYATPPLTSRQREALVVLCRPLWNATGPSVPATNKAIADELCLSVPAVVTHIRALFEKFAIEDLPQNQKRARLAELAILAQAVSERDL